MDSAEQVGADATLVVGTVATSVSVEGEKIGQVPTECAQLGGTATGTQISRLEPNGRTYKHLAGLIPGVNNMTGSDEGVVGVISTPAYSVNGHGVRRPLRSRALRAFSSLPLKDMQFNSQILFRILLEFRQEIS